MKVLFLVGCLLVSLPSMAQTRPSTCCSTEDEKTMKTKWLNEIEQKIVAEYNSIPKNCRGGEKVKGFMEFYLQISFKDSSKVAPDCEEGTQRPCWLNFEMQKLVYQFTENIWVDGLIQKHGIKPEQVPTIVKTLETINHGYLEEKQKNLIKFRDGMKKVP